MHSSVGRHAGTLVFPDAVFKKASYTMTHRDQQTTNNPGKISIIHYIWDESGIVLS
jgi:hypothetical protein